MKTVDTVELSCSWEIMGISAHFWEMSTATTALKKVEKKYVDASQLEDTVHAVRNFGQCVAYPTAVESEMIMSYNVTISND